MKKFPPLERAIIKTYGIDEAERKDTRYAYEILDLDGDGGLDVLAIVSGLTQVAQAVIQPCGDLPERHL